MAELGDLFVCTKRLPRFRQGIGRTGGCCTFQGLEGRSNIIMLSLENCSARGKWCDDGALVYRNIPSNGCRHVAPDMTWCAFPSQAPFPP